DILAGGETLPQLAARCGVLIGGALPHHNRLADPTYKAVWERQSSCYAVTAKPADVAREEGVYDFAGPLSVVAQAGARPSLLHVVTYPEQSPTWMQEAATAQNWQDIVTANLMAYAPMIAAVDTVQVFNEALHPTPATVGWRDTWLSQASGGD